MNQADIRQWWHNLAARERKLLGAGVFVLLLVFYALFLYRPLVNAVREAENRNRALISQWQWMQQQLPLIASHRDMADPSSPRDFSEPLLNWLDKQLSDAKLQAYVKRMEPVDDSRVTLWLEKVPFAPLMRWVEQVQTTQGVLVSEFDAMPVAGSPGLVTVRMTFYQP